LLGLFLIRNGWPYLVHGVYSCGCPLCSWPDRLDTSRKCLLLSVVTIMTINSGSFPLRLGDFACDLFDERTKVAVSLLREHCRKKCPCV